MKKFNQHQIQAIETGEARTQKAFFGKSGQKHKVKIVAAIIAVIVLHSILQFVFFRGEELFLKAEIVSGKITEIKSEKKQSVEATSEIAMKKPDIVKMPDAPAQNVQPEPKIVRSRVVIKKKEPRLSEAQRLRRAERILTGV